MSVISHRSVINKANKTLCLLHTPTPTLCGGGGLRGGRPGLVSGRDVLLTWLQDNYSRQLDRDLPPETTLAAADLAPGDSTTPWRSRIRGHLREALIPPHPHPPVSTEWTCMSLFQQPWPLLLLLLVSVVCWRCLERLTSWCWHNLSCVAAESLWAWWCLWPANIKWEEISTPRQPAF